MASGQKVASLFAEFGADTSGFERGARRVQSQMGSVAQRFQAAGEVGVDALNGLGLNLSQFAGAAGVGAAVAAAGKFLYTMEQMREESAQVEARFIAFTGGTGRAAEALAAFDRALGNAATRDQKMAAAAQIMGLGITRNAKEAAELARQAAVLGIEIDTVAKAMETGRVSALVPYGISVQAVKARAVELQAAQKDLSDVQASAIAIQEQLAEKTKLVEEAGGLAATSITQLKNAWADYMDATASSMSLNDVVSKAGPLGAAIAAIFDVPDNDSFIGKLRDAVNTMTSLRILTDENARASDRLAAAEQRLNEHLATKARLGNIPLPSVDADIAKLQTLISQWKIYGDQADEVDAALRRYLEASSAVNAAQENLAAETAKVGEENAGAAAEALALAEAEREAAQAAYQAADASARAAMAAAGATGAFGQAAVAAGAYGAALGGIGPERKSERVPSKTRWGMYADWGSHFVESGEDPVKAWMDRQKAANKTTATDFARQYGGAVDDVAGQFQSALQDAANVSIGLSDLRPGGGDPFAAGSGGPFEDVFRLQAWLKDGSWAETAAAKGFGEGDQGKVAALIGQFQQGIITPEVEKLFNKEALVQYIEQQELGKATREAFVNSLAAETGGDASMISALLGFAPNGQDEGGQAGKVDLSGFMPAFVTGLQAEIEANRDTLASQGAALWDVLGEAFVKRAGQSGAFAAAVTKLVEEALAAGLEE